MHLLWAILLWDHMILHSCPFFFVPDFWMIIAFFVSTWQYRCIVQLSTLRALAHLKHWYRGGSVQQLELRTKVGKLPKHIAFLLLEKDISLHHLARYRSLIFKHLKSITLGWSCGVYRPEYAWSAFLILRCQRSLIFFSLVQKQQSVLLSGIQLDHFRLEKCPQLDQAFCRV